MDVERSDNASGAVNQQERLDAYVAGFVDGEGCFHVAIQRNPSTKLGWQLVPEFRVSQDSDRLEALRLVATRIGCGTLRENHRGSNDHTLVLVVRRRPDLLGRVIPFFERNPLVSAKQQEFLRFARIVRAMDRGEHLAAEGFGRMAREALEMIRRRPLPAPPSELTIQNPQRPYAEHPRHKRGVKIWSDLHGDMQSQAEMSWPPAIFVGGNNNVGPYPMQP